MIFKFIIGFVLLCALVWVLYTGAKFAFRTFTSAQLLGAAVTVVTAALLLVGIVALF